ncbi:Mitochondrial transcription factor 1 [Pseudozyma hubeiensis]|nr:Mitochondrial transcription factor 1 [Pseudozyma hubeiensis]
MASIARTRGASIAQLAATFRTAVTIPLASRGVLSAPSHAASSSRGFRSSTAFASSSTSASSSTENDIEVKPEKPKRRRRSREEIQAAQLAKLAFGVPIRSQKRTRTALGGSVAPTPESETVSLPKRGRGRPSNKSREAQKEAAERETQRSAPAAAAPAPSPTTAEQPLSTEVMQELLAHMSYDHLPPRDEWKTEFPVSKQYETSYRYFVSNRSTIKDIISHLGIKDPERNGEKVTIIEGYPGPGTFASELLKLDEVDKVIALEGAPCYFKRIELLRSQLEEKHAGAGARLDTLESSAYMWETYNELVTSGKLAHLNGRVLTSEGKPVDFTTDQFVAADHSDASWQKLSPMIFFAQLPNTVYGEQLFAQIITAIASRSWLFRHGRIKLGFVCGESLAKRSVAEAGDKVSRGKLGTTVQCLADIQVHRYAHDLAPHTHHFFPPTMSVGPRVTVSGSSIIPNSNPSTGLTRTGMVMMTVTPKANPLIKPTEIEAFEFITRNLFILRTKPVAEALTHVAPGGQNVLKMTGREQVEKGLIREEEVIRPDEIVSDLTNAQWACLARMFEKWPFRPKHLFEEGRIRKDNKNRN